MVRTSSPDVRGLRLLRCPFCYDGCFTCGFTGWLMQKLRSRA
jgi:hypothetical protein